MRVLLGIRNFKETRRCMARNYAPSFHRRGGLFHMAHSKGLTPYNPLLKNVWYIQTFDAPHRAFNACDARHCAAFAKGGEETTSGDPCANLSHFLFV
jgi:hypothetical protein